ncbi:MAG: flagellar biosynthesis protein FliQ [Pseudomonadota bacterium]
MTPESILSIGQQALWVTFAISSPLLLSALLVGLAVGMLQAATQINEMTLSFIPKLLILGVALMLGGPWIIGTLVDFTHQLITNIPNLIG